MNHETFFPEMWYNKILCMEDAMDRIRIDLAQICAAAGKTEEVLTRENLQRASLFRQDTFTEQWCIQTAENQ